MLEEGGNAFDAVLAAQFAAAVAEPVLTSLGGGGFLVARTAGGRALVYDFFAHTPIHRRAANAVEFYPVLADFGTETQEFYIGMASIATPGTIKGLFQIHRDLCTLPVQRIIEPAVTIAHRGVRITALQEYLFRVVEPILGARPESWAIYRSGKDYRRPHIRGELLKQPLLADTLERLAVEGDGLFYRGEIGQRLVRDCRDLGGNLRAEDLADYRVKKRKPLAFRYRGARVLTNPLPSCGGTLVAFSLKLLEQLDIGALGSGTTGYLTRLAQNMEQTNRARAASKIDHYAGPQLSRKLLGKKFMRDYHQAVTAHPFCGRGTTHISVIDEKGNMASMTTSNGEGSGYVLPGTGIMMNNMLGEKDINPRGFHKWPRNRRMTSMMAPTLVITADEEYIALGSGGSNRIRSAMLQTLANLLDFRMPLRRAVCQPRIHFEDGLLSIEAGFRRGELAKLKARFPRHRMWNEKNLFFGGVHAAYYDRQKKRYDGAGDPRRGGISIIVK